MVAVLHLTLRSDRTGGPLYLKMLLEGLQPKIKNFVFCPPDGDVAEDFAAIVGKGRVIDAPVRRFSLSALLALARFVRRNRIDVLHSHGKGAGLYSRLVGIVVGVPVVHTFHGVHMGGYNSIARVVYQIYERMFSLVTATHIAVSKSERTEIVARGLASASKVHAILTGLKTEVPLSVGLEPGVIRALNYTRFDEQKNFQKIVDIACIAAFEKGMRSRIKFVIAGKGERMQYYMDCVRELGIAEMFEFLGEVKDVESLRQTCNVLISTSKWEGLPLAVLEAGRSGLYLALSDIPAHRELMVDGLSGILFKNDSRPDVAEMLDRVAAYSEASVVNVGAVHLLDESFNYNRMIESHLQLYGRVSSCQSTTANAPLEEPCGA